MRGKLKNMNEISADSTGSFELLPEGVYIVRVVERKDGESKNHDPMINIKLEVTKGEQKGSATYDNILLSTNPDSPGYRVRWRAKQFLKAIGEPYEGNEFEWNSSDWLFKECKIFVKHEKQTYIDKNGDEQSPTKAIVRQYSPLGDPNLVASGETTKPKAAVVEDSEIPF